MISESSLYVELIPCSMPMLHSMSCLIRTNCLSHFVRYFCPELVIISAIKTGTCVHVNAILLYEKQSLF